jgi:hypothetical protein
VDSLSNSGGRISHSGIFVSTGAVGLSLGIISGYQKELPVLFPMLLLAASIVLILLFGMKNTVARAVFHTLRRPAGNTALPLRLIMSIAIAIRSYGGFILYLPWKAEYMILPGVSACIGKAAGGMLADRAGAAATGSASLIAGIPLLLFGSGSPVLCSAGIALFQHEHAHYPLRSVRRFIRPPRPRFRIHYACAHAGSDTRFLLHDAMGNRVHRAAAVVRSGVDIDIHIRIK